MYILRIHKLLYILFVQVTCQLLGVVFEEKTPEELQVQLAMIVR
jgi:hypothetical protein